MIQLCKWNFCIMLIMYIMASSLNTYACNQQHHGFYIYHGDNKPCELILEAAVIDSVKFGFDPQAHQPRLSVYLFQNAAGSIKLVDLSNKELRYYFHDSLIIKDNKQSRIPYGVWHISHQYTYEEASRIKTYIYDVIPFSKHYKKYDNVPLMNAYQQMESAMATHKSLDKILVADTTYVMWKDGKQRWTTFSANDVKALKGTTRIAAVYKNVVSPNYYRTSTYWENDETAAVYEVVAYWYRKKRKYTLHYINFKEQEAIQ